MWQINGLSEKTSGRKPQLSEDVFYPPLGLQGVTRTPFYQKVLLKESDKRADFKAAQWLRRMVPSLKGLLKGGIKCSSNCVVFTFFQVWKRLILLDLFLN